MRERGRGRVRERARERESVSEGQCERETLRTGLTDSNVYNTVGVRPQGTDVACIVWYYVVFVLCLCTVFYALCCIGYKLLYVLYYMLFIVMLIVLYVYINCYIVFLC